MVWTQALRRVAAREMIPKLFGQGYSATAALRVFSDIGPGLRRKLWLADWREIIGAKKLERTYRFIPKKYRLSFQMMAPAEVRQKHEFRYVFDAYGKNLETGEQEIRTVSFGDDTRFSQEDAESEMTADMDTAMDHYKDAYSWEFERVEFMVAYRRVTPTVPWDEAITEAERRAYLGL